MMSRDQIFGAKWEQWALKQLKLRGYSDARLVSDWFASVDIMLGTLPIEVKAANPKKHFSGRCWRTRWEFDVSRLPKLVDSLVILIAVDDDYGYPFVIPSWLLSCRNNVHITSHPMRYKGYFKRFLGTWEWVDIAIATNSKYSGQLSLFLGTGDSLQNNQNGDTFLDQLGRPSDLSPSLLLQGA